jgi:hypothetical protein
MFLIKTIYEDGEIEFCLYKNLTEHLHECQRLKRIGVKFTFEIITN